MQKVSALVIEAMRDAHSKSVEVALSCLASVSYAWLRVVQTLEETKPACLRPHAYNSFSLRLMLVQAVNRSHAAWQYTCSLQVNMQALMLLKSCVSYLHVLLC